MGRVRGAVHREWPRHSIVAVTDAVINAANRAVVAAFRVIAGGRVTLTWPI